MISPTFLKHNRQVKIGDSDPVHNTWPPLRLQGDLISGRKLDYIDDVTS